MSGKICFYTPPYPGMTSYTEIIDLAVTKGLDAVEGFCNFEFAQPDVQAAKEIRQYADARGIKIPCFSLFCDVAGETAKENVDRLCRYAEIAAILGSPFLHHTIACDFSDPQAILARKEAFFEQGIQSVRAVYDCAASMGVRAIYEDQGFVFNGVAGFRRFIDTVDRNVGAVADFGNIAQVEESVVDFIRAFPEQIVHAHIKDLKPVAKDDIGPGCLETIYGNWVQEAEVGTGTLRIEEGINLLRKSGYDGYYAIEYQGAYPGDLSIDRTIEKIQGWLS